MKSMVFLGADNYTLLVLVSVTTSSLISVQYTTNNFNHYQCIKI